MSSTWSKALLSLVSLAAIWLLAGGAIGWVRASRPTPESIVKYVGAHPLEGQSASERRARPYCIARCGHPGGALRKG